MTPSEFCYWPQGFMELNGIDKKPRPISAELAEMIQKHLDLVFDQKVDRTPSSRYPTPEEVEARARREHSIEDAKVCSLNESKGVHISAEEAREILERAMNNGKRSRGSTPPFKKPPTKRPPGVRLSDDDCGGKRYC